MKAKNYDGRTALHLAASEGHLSCVKFLVETCNLDPLAKDRYPHFYILDYESLNFMFDQVIFFLRKLPEFIN